MKAGPSIDDSTGSLARRIYLIGFMAAGKTTIGSALGEILRVPFVDLDQAIEQQTGERVREIFERHGESRFRDLEHECLRRTAELEQCVIATGGGTMVSRRNREVIRQLGVSVWIDPGFEVLLARLGRSRHSDRPLFRDEDQTRELYRCRLDAYRMADLRIESGSEETAQSVAASIASLLRERSCAI